MNSRSQGHVMQLQRVRRHQCEQLREAYQDVEFVTGLKNEICAWGRGLVLSVPEVLEEQMWDPGCHTVTLKLAK